MWLIRHSVSVVRPQYLFSHIGITDKHQCRSSPLVLEASQYNQGLISILFPSAPNRTWHQDLLICLIGSYMNLIVEMLLECISHESKLSLHSIFLGKGSSGLHGVCLTPRLCLIRTSSRILAELGYILARQCSLSNGCSPLQRSSTFPPPR